LHPPLRHRILGARALLALALLFLFVAGAAAGAARGVYAQESNAASNSSMTFAAVFTRASYGNLETSYNTVAVEDADLNMLLSTGARCIRIDIGYAPWLDGNQTAIREMTSLVQAIRAAGKCLIIADAASESYRGGGQLTWSQFMAAWVTRVATLAALYHPDYYVVIKEPGWYVPMISDASTNPQFQSVSVWLSLTQNLTNAVLSASPSTEVGVAIAANSLTQAQGAFYAQYLNEVQGIPGLSFIGFDCYGPSDQAATQKYLSANPPTKAVWIPEAWSTSTGGALDGSPSQDAQWMQSVYTFASSIHATFLIPFYTDHFASYSLTSSSPANAEQIIALYQQRTPIFSVFQELATAVSGSSTATSSTTSSSIVSSSTSPNGPPSSSTTGYSSSQAAHGSSTTSSGGKGIFSTGAVILELLVLVVLIGAVVYFRKRSSAS